FTGYMWDTEVQKGSIRRAIEIARKNGVTVAFDLADPFAVERYRDDFLVLLERDVDVVFANRTEAQILYETEDAELAARMLGEHTRIAALKVGKDGSVVTQRVAGTAPLRISSVPGRPLAVTDTTGAGDMFAAGFLAALAKGYDPVRAAGAAGWLAEAVIQQIGAQFSVARIRELKTEMETALADST
ncbi:MAG: PfkB family carbohydrate kinase, partial [Alkalispirochaeta sp.]